jgi:hypothetical protein
VTGLVSVLETPRGQRGLVLPLLGVFLLTGCPPAHVATAALVEKDQLTETLTAAETAWSHRPDVAEVRRSVTLFLSAALSDETRTEGDIGVIRGVAWLIEHRVKEERGTLVATALAAGERCVARAPNTPCDYWKVVARGLGARENPATGLGEAKSIIEALHRLEATQSRTEDGGPSRMLALLLLRAPGWPVGPGDADAGLVEARKALALVPGHPLNHLVLGEALAATGDTEGAKAAYFEAKRLGQQRAAAGDPDGADWAAQAEAAMDKL